MKKLKIDVNERPPLTLWALLSIQHVFGMFSATVLVPIIVGLPVSVALFASGVGTIIYSILTKFKVPVYLGSSFAFITAMLMTNAAMGGAISATQTGLIMVGIVYVLVGLLVKVVGKDWIGKLLPPVVIGPMIAVIGLGLANWAVTQSGLIEGGNPDEVLVALITLLITVYFMIKGKGFARMIPFLGGIIGGYLVAAIFGLVDITPIADASLFKLPEFTIWGLDYAPYFGPEAWAIVPIVIVTIAEHIGDHTVLGKICEKPFLQDPGLDRTLMGDGIATAVSAFLGGPANTTYGENTGIIGATKVGSVYVTVGAAAIAVLLSFSGVVSAAISTIPAPVLGGISLLLYGVIASNGLRVLIDAKVDFTKNRNLIIASVMLVLGLGGAVFQLFGMAALSGVALAGISGVFLNWLLPE